MKKTQHDNKHMTIDERIIIQTEIENGSSKTSIASVIRKEPSSVAKEIRKHRVKKSRNTSNRPCICVHLRDYGRKCIRVCERYEELKCRRRDISPGACNGCGKLNRC